MFSSQISFVFVSFCFRSRRLVVDWFSYITRINSYRKVVRLNDLLLSCCCWKEEKEEEERKNGDRKEKCARVCSGEGKGTAEVAATTAVRASRHDHAPFRFFGHGGARYCVCVSHTYTRNSEATQKKEKKIIRQSTPQTLGVVWCRKEYIRHTHATSREWEREKKAGTEKEGRVSHEPIGFLVLASTTTQCVCMLCALTALPPASYLWPTHTHTHKPMRKIYSAPSPAGKRVFFFFFFFFISPSRRRIRKRLQPCVCVLLRDHLLPTPTPTTTHTHSGKKSCRPANRDSVVHKSWNKPQLIIFNILSSFAQLLLLVSY